MISSIYTTVCHGSSALGYSWQFSLCLPPSLPPSLSLTLLLFYFSLGLRRPQAAQERRDPRYLASLSLCTEISSSSSSRQPSLDRLPIIRSKGYPFRARLTRKIMEREEENRSFPVSPLFSLQDSSIGTLSGEYTGKKGKKR